MNELGPLQEQIPLGNGLLYGKASKRSFRSQSFDAIERRIPSLITLLKINRNTRLRPIALKPLRSEWALGWLAIQRAFANWYPRMWPKALQRANYSLKPRSRFIMFSLEQNLGRVYNTHFLVVIHTYIHTYIHKLYLSSDFSVAYIASISDPNLLILKVTTYII